MKKEILLSFFSIILIVSTTAFTGSSNNFNITKGTFSEGSIHNGSSNNYKLECYITEEPIGNGSVNDFKSCLGYYCIPFLYCGDGICSANIGETYQTCPEDCVEIIAPEEKGTTGATPKKVYYDLIVNVKQFFYNRKDLINATITIKNMGDYPDDDVTLSYHLLSPSNITFSEYKKWFKEPNIGNSTYNITIQLPPQSELGKWKLIVELDIKEQGKLTAYDSFYVTKKKILFALIIIIFILLMLIFIVLFTTIILKSKRR